MTTNAATAAAVNNVAGRRQMPAECIDASNGAAPARTARVAAVGGVCAAAGGNDAGAVMRFESGRDAGDCRETSAAASATSGRAARATGSMTAEIASGRRRTGRWPTGRLAIGRLSLMGAEADAAVDSTPSEDNDLVPCVRASAALPESPRAERRRAEIVSFDGTGNRFIGNIGVPDASELRTSADTAAAGGTAGGETVPGVIALGDTLISGAFLGGTALDGTFLGAKFLGAKSLGGTFLGATALCGKFFSGTSLDAAFLSGTSLDGTAAADPAALH